ncbi:protein of unknown function [Hyphomicrobium sp. 1Nfss2.1]|uniref:hypothetical protein n=1 Tax=Hyphomicrobium sp. 1Nfss2.1 TaxID=3413936 RepID=UPI003C7A8D7D
MTSVNITVADIGPSDTNQGWRWSVNRDGEEVEFGLAADQDAAYAAAKPLFDRLRAEMTDHTRRMPAAPK